MIPRAVPIAALMLLLGAPIPAVAVPAPFGRVEIVVTDVGKAQGRVHVDLCSEALFMTDNCRYSGEAAAVAGTTIVVIPDVPPGRYAAQAFHDLNGSGKLERGLFGIPKEPIGISRDAPIHFRPPSFADAAFDHGSEPQRITFKLRTKFF